MPCVAVLYEVTGTVQRQQEEQFSSQCTGSSCAISVFLIRFSCGSSCPQNKIITTQNLNNDSAHPLIFIFFFSQTSCMEKPTKDHIASIEEELESFYFFPRLDSSDLFIYFFEEYHFKIPSIINYTHSLFFDHFCSFRSQRRVTEAPRLVLTRCPTSVLFRELCSFCVEECDS